jgi:hypothetical protein
MPAGGFDVMRLGSKAQAARDPSETGSDDGESVLGLFVAFCHEA